MWPPPVVLGKGFLFVVIDKRGQIISKTFSGKLSGYLLQLIEGFTFKKNIRVSVEVWPQEKPTSPAIWGSTAFWYALKPQNARSRKDLLPTQQW